MTELAGVLVGDYFLLECLSREGQVETYRARPTTRAGYDVLLRLFRPSFLDPTNFRIHFTTEVEKIWHCQHEGLLPLYAFGAGDELLYCATLFPEMETLEHFFERQTQRILPIERVLYLMVQLCDAVEYLHMHNVVHGNIQPSSIYLRNGQDAVLTNYGMRRAYQEGEQLASLLDEGNVVYTAPEQSLGMICPASDIYALGVLFYRLLSGFSPYDGITSEEIMWQHVNDPLPSLCALRSDMLEAIEVVVRKALARQPEQRFTNPHVLAEALLTTLISDNKRDAYTQAESTKPRRVHVNARHIPFSRT